MFDAKKMFNIIPSDNSLLEAIQNKIHGKTKPPGSLGILESIALKIALIQKTLTPTLRKPCLLLFAGDHGIVAEGVSPYPQVVTQQMVKNFVDGGAAINVFCRQHAIEIDVVDAGVKGDLSDLPIIHAKVGHGTRNFLYESAMSMAECEQAMARGAMLVRATKEAGSNIIGLGEMGIGNTSSAAVLFSSLSGLPIEQCVGRGTGLDDEGLLHKTAILKQALARHGDSLDPFQTLATFGGYEIAMMCGALLAACELQIVVLVDGFIASSAAAVAFELDPAAKDYCIFSHLSDESGHRVMLDYLGVTPMVSLGLRLGEGSGVAVTYPLIVSSINFLNEMASFESAGVATV
jgi:nicotinate-nucleotide--dimethylbenzimidazole phosphoribosyltransferase